MFTKIVRFLRAHFTRNENCDRSDCHKMATRFGDGHAKSFNMPFHYAACDQFDHYSLMDAKVIILTRGGGMIN